MHHTCTVLYCRLWPDCLYNIFAHDVIYDKIFGGKNFIQHKKCVLIFSTNVAEASVTVGIPKGIIINIQTSARLHVKHPPFFSCFNKTLIFSTDVQKNSQISNFIKTHLVAAQMFHADRQACRNQ